MKKFAFGLLATTALCAGLCQGASAADMAVRAAPPPAPIYAPTWTGFYVGGNLGSAWAQNDTTVDITGTGFGIPLASQGQRGFLGGVQGGYNYQMGVVVLGIEADADWGDIKGTAPCVVVLSCTGKIKSLGDVGGRVGFTADKALVYIKGGWAWAGTDYTISAASLGGGSATGSTTRSGGFLGAGVEYAFLPNWSAKVEYDYYDFGTKNINQFHARGSRRRGPAQRQFESDGTLGQVRRQLPLQLGRLRLLIRRIPLQRAPGMPGAFCCRHRRRAVNQSPRQRVRIRNGCDRAQ
jgi:outer membrane immunogenic protein